MQLFFSHFAFLLVLFYILTVASTAPVPRITKVIPQTHAEDLNQISTHTESYYVKPRNLGSVQSTPLFKYVWEQKTEKNKEPKKFRSCMISNKIYEHKEKIPRANPCDYCTCLDSEMYCLWKLCTILNLTAVSSVPFNTALFKQENPKQSNNDNNLVKKKNDGTKKRTHEIETTDEKFSKILKDQRKYNALKKLKASQNAEPEVFKIRNIITTTGKPTVCYVMGVAYKYGEILPRDTGTCLECACSEEGRITCSPKDCVSQPDLDYLSHNNNLDMFDLDTF